MQKQQTHEVRILRNYNQVKQSPPSPPQDIGKRHPITMQRYKDAVIQQRQLISEFEQTGNIELLEKCKKYVSLEHRKRRELAIRINYIDEGHLTRLRNLTTKANCLTFCINNPEKINMDFLINLFFRT